MLSEHQLEGFSEPDPDLIPDLGNLNFAHSNFNLVNLDPDYAPMPPGPGPPSTEEFTQIANFRVEIDGSNTHKKKFLYSHKLNCLFLNSMHNFSVGFSWDKTAVTSPMYVGSTLVFADPSDAEKRVQTCLQHVKDDKVSSEVVNGNVLRSSRELNDPDVFYFGGPETNTWYSVLVRLPAPSSHAYYFVCKNSCSSGINRRPLNLIFTLQDDIGVIYGRQVVGVRVCSCPKRDMCRAESTEEGRSTSKKGKRPIKVETDTNNTNTTNATNTVSVPNTPRRKRMKVETDACDTIVTIPSFQVVGPRVALAGLEVMLSMMKQTKDVKVKTHQNIDDINTKITEIEKVIENIQSSNTTV